MSEVMVYGTKVWGGCGYEVGCLNEQFPLFRLDPKSIHRRLSYWLRSIRSEDNFSYVSLYGSAGNTTASDDHSVIPFFFIVENNASAVTLEEIEEIE